MTSPSPETPETADARAASVAQELESEHPEFDDVPTIEADETVPPRPEEAIADVARAEPDPS